ncbi:hypothetical protein [Nonomuraea recticatena]|uniref:Uncharacterized protein n=1 Tax=Nonomuraea recticatena TaxID=46178 RepID=A0ABN3SUH4_9ACTN
MSEAILIPAEWLADPRLTFEQVGMLAYLASFPDGHVFDIETVGTEIFADDLAARLSAIGALRLRGYVVFRGFPEFTLCPRTDECPRDVE